MASEHRQPTRRRPLLSLLRLLLVATVLALYGCGGGGGGDHAAADDPAERELRFSEEAVDRLLDRAHVSCDAVVCDGDATVDTVADPLFDTISTGCQYTCMPVEIDADEERFYWVWLAWRRRPDTCFVYDDYDRILIAEVTVPCVPTQ